jgi:DNA-binding protein Fis
LTNIDAVDRLQEAVEGLRGFPRDWQAANDEYQKAAQQCEKARSALQLADDTASFGVKSLWDYSSVYATMEGGRTPAPQALPSLRGPVAGPANVPPLNNPKPPKAAVSRRTLNCPRVPSRITAVIAKLEKQRRALDQILITLYEIEANIVAKPGQHPLLDENEEKLIVSALKKAKGNQSAAARLLGIGRDRLRYKIAKYEIRS